MALRARIEVAALRIFDDDAVDPVRRIVVVGAVRTLEADDHRTVLAGEADHHHRLAAPEQPVHRGAGRVLTRVVAVIVVMVPRLHPPEHGRDRDRVQTGIPALVELAPQVEDGLRGQRIFRRGVVLDDPAARRRARERVTGRILELGEPLHAGERVAHRLEGMVERERPGRRRDRELRQIVGRAAEEPSASDRPLEPRGIDRCVAGEAGIGRHRDLGAVDLRRRLPGDAKETGCLRTTGVVDKRHHRAGRRARAGGGVPG